MRAALVMEDVFAADGEAAAMLQRLQAADVQPVIVAVQPPSDAGKVEFPGFRHVVGPAERLGGSAEPSHLLVEAVGQADAALSEAFLICRSAAEAATGVDHGCRVMVVLGDRTLDDVFGPDEPAHKSVGVAPDLATAVSYMLDEAAEARQIGPFPYAQTKVEERPPVMLPTRGDLAKILLLVVIAGVAIALGIAYLLREVYTTFTFPSEAYWLTLQFIPRAWRGVLFLFLGTGLGLFAGYAVARLRFRR